LKRIAIVAGESSGDLLGAALIRALRARYEGLEFYGIAGPRMLAEGARTLYPIEKLSVRGYVEVLKHLPEIYGIRRKLGRAAARGATRSVHWRRRARLQPRPREAPQVRGHPHRSLRGPFALGVAAGAHPRIKRSVDHMLVLFPFEEAIYRKAGVPVSYVGHPLADALPLKPDRDDARAQLRLPAHTTAIALLPGSRQSELEFHADLLIRTARKLHQQRPELRFFVPLATRETHAYFEARLYALEARDLPLSTLFGHATLALHAADAAIVASGTATLEAALARCPMVIMYRVPPLTFALMKRKAPPAVRRPAEHPRRRIRGARVPAGGSLAREPRPGAGELARREGDARTPAGALRRSPPQPRVRS
jgi:lipid-A-disaccharide synthase